MYIWARRLFRKNFKNPENKIIAFDRDTNAIKLSEKFKKNLKIGLNSIIKNLVKLKTIDIKNIKAIIFDLGYSTNQIFDEEKGFIF